MGCCSGIARCILITVNFLFILLGLALTGLGAYAMIQFKEFSSVVRMWQLGVILGIGIFIALLACLGFFGACLRKRCLLYLYVFLVLIIVLAQFALGAIVCIYSGDLKNGATDCPWGNFVPYGIGGAAGPSCNVSVVGPDNYCNVAMPSCGVLTPRYSNPTFMNPVSNFADCVYATCCSGTAGYNATKQYLTGTKCVTAGHVISEPVCQAARDLKINGQALVDCNGSLNTFRTNLFKFVSDNSLLLGGVALGFAGLQLLAIFFACVIIVKNPEEFDQH